MSTQTNRVRSTTSARIDVLRKRLDRAIRFAKTSGLVVADKVWSDGAKVCPISARILQTNANGTEVVSELQNDVEGGDCAFAARHAGMTRTEVYYFIEGFDGANIEKREPDAPRLTSKAKRSYALGQAFRNKLL